MKARLSLPSFFLVLLIALFPLTAQADCPPFETSDVDIYLSNTGTSWIVQAPGTLEVTIEHPTLGSQTFTGTNSVSIPLEYWTPSIYGPITMAVRRVCKREVSQPVYFYREPATVSLIGDEVTPGDKDLDLASSGGGTVTFAELCYGETAITTVYLGDGTDPDTPAISTDCFCAYVQNGFWAYDDYQSVNYGVTPNYQATYNLPGYPVFDAVSDASVPDLYFSEIYLNGDILSQSYDDNIYDYWQDPLTYTGQSYEQFVSKICSGMNKVAGEEGKSPATILTTNQDLIAPNPTQGILSVQLKNEFVSEYSVYSIDGRVMERANVADVSSFEINLFDFDSGLYLVSYKLTNGEVRTKTVVKN